MTGAARLVRGLRAHPISRAWITKHAIGPAASALAGASPAGTSTSLIAGDEKGSNAMYSIKLIEGLSSPTRRVITLLPLPAIEGNREVLDQNQDVLSHRLPTKSTSSASQPNAV
jgi:hypothetical protein